MVAYNIKAGWYGWDEPEEPEGLRAQTASATKTKPKGGTKTAKGGTKESK